MVQSNTANSNTTTAISPPAGTAMCSSANADLDGDGWGWENNNSCFVMPASATSPSTNTSPPANNNGFSVCSSPNADEDGDGYGWENNSSCIVATNNQSTTTNNSTPPPAIAGEKICSTAAADEDGDGWGWENNDSCVVANNSSGNTNPPQTAPANIRIMAVGDSITHGNTFQFAQSYRKPLTEKLIANSCQFEMTGSQTGNHLHNSYIAPHEGYNGHSADEILFGHNDIAGNNEGISVTVARYQPSVVLLHIGTNDIVRQESISNTVSEIDQIISIALSANSAPAVLVANVIPYYRFPSTGISVKALGDQIEAYVRQLNNPRVVLVDVRSGFQQSMMLGDGIHPNPAGEQYIANQFFDAYRNAGFCR